MVIYRNMIELLGDGSNISNFRKKILNKSVNDALPIPSEITDEKALDDWVMSNRGYRGNEIVLSWLSDNSLIIDTPSYPCIQLVEKLHDMCPNIEFVMTFASDVVGKNTGTLLINSDGETLTRFDNFSKDAYEASYKLRPHEMIVHQTDTKLNLRCLYDISDFLSIIRDRGVYKDTEGAELRFIK